MQKLNQNIHASIIGNILEWYEFSLFAYLSPVIAGLFFPSQNRIASLLSTLLVFGAGFVVRPIGSIVLGHLGDCWGRAKTLKLTIFLLSISSILTGFLPTYQQVGLWSPALLILCRLLQGFCIGGEFAGSMIYLSEMAPAKHRAFISSMSNNGSNIGVFIAIASCAIYTHYIGVEAMSNYGWRVLFVLGGLLGLMGLWLRRSLKESQVFQSLQQNISEKYMPLLYVLSQQKKKMLAVFILLFTSACGSYTLMGYLSTYLHEFLDIPLEQAYKMQTGFIVLSLILLPIFAYVSDKVGHKKIFLLSTIGYLLFSIPSFMILEHQTYWWVLIPLVIFYSAEQAVTPVIMVELFSGKGRYTGISLAYNVCMATVGGFSAVINTWLIHFFNTPLMIGYYVTICGVISLWASMKWLPESYGASRNLSAV